MQEVYFHRVINFLLAWVSMGPNVQLKDCNVNDDVQMFTLKDNQFIYEKADGCITIDETYQNEIWVGPLANRKWAVILLNRGLGPDSEICLEFAKIGLGGKVVVRDLYKRSQVGTFENRYCDKIPSHSAKMFTLTPQ